MFLKSAIFLSLIYYENVQLISFGVVSECMVWWWLFWGQVKLRLYYLI